MWGGESTRAVFEAYMGPTEEKITKREGSRKKRPTPYQHAGIPITHEKRPQGHLQLTPRLPPPTGNRPPNAPTHRQPLLALHNLPHPPLNQHPRFQTTPLRSAAALLGLRGLPRPAGTRERPGLDPDPAGESVPEPLRRQCD
jgi:hypothetical protein